MQESLTRATCVALLAGVYLLASPLQGLARAQSVEWLSVDVGDPALPGSARLARTGTFTIDAAGEGVASKRDGFHFTYRMFTGDIDVRARIGGLAGALPSSVAGVMIRTGLEADAPHAASLLMASGGSVFRSRASGGGDTAETGGPSLTAPAWVRLVRQGSQVTSFVSADGENWMSSGTRSVELGNQVLVGIAVTSAQPSVRTTVTVSEITIDAGALPDGEVNRDIGSPAPAGTVRFDGSKYTITAGGTDIGGASDQFHFVYQQVSGDVELVARVDSITQVDKGAKSGLMIRESLDPASAHASIFATAAQGYAFQRRHETGAPAKGTSGPKGGPPGWIRLVRTGALFESYHSTDGSGWTKVGSDTVPMDRDVLVGIAVTSRNTRKATVSIVSRYTVTVVEPANREPVVSLDTPTDGATVRGSSSVLMSATASDPDGSITAVEFYADSVLLARLTQAPYAFTFSAELAPGTYSIKAVAYDDDNASVSSNVSRLTIVDKPRPQPDPEPEGLPRAVAFRASSNHAGAVTSYVLEVYKTGANIGKDKPVATIDLGKPSPDANGEITADGTAFFKKLAAGKYLATVMAVGKGGSARSTAVAFTR